MTLANKTGWGLAGMVAVATVANVWVYLTPAAATSLQEQRSLREDITYMRGRIDEIYDATVRQGVQNEHTR